MGNSLPDRNLLERLKRLASEASQTCIMDGFVDKGNVSRQDVLSALITKLQSKGIDIQDPFFSKDAAHPIGAGNQFNAYQDNMRQTFSSASVVFTLFIGFLISGATAQKFEEFDVAWMGYYCIFGRSLTAILGVILQYMSFHILSTAQHYISAPLHIGPNAKFPFLEVEKSYAYLVLVIRMRNIISSGCNFCE
jgi:hypothetical protein